MKDIDEDDEVVATRPPCAECGSSLDRHWCIPSRSEAEILADLLKSLPFQVDSERE